ncbi:uncharacterized protein LOC116338871 [Contarinia nasturtii]|uniref:uncharacterized protein LOC116338871 n=1 Tax=Contarinia nasturtii TaxID=265458 RepID=UPI0012D4C265|nr:uncharacterized protein LOC116338871 [Contarinia nasturtii]
MAEEAAKPVGRPMKYPYTFSAKIAQFPYKLYFTHPNSWLYKYWAISIVLCTPFFYKIHKAVNSPGNVALWKEKERLEALEHERGHH